MQVNKALGLPDISPSAVSYLRRSEFSDCIIKRRGDMFARCGTCDRRKQLRSAHAVGSTAYVYYADALQRHLAEQEAHRQAYYASRYLSIQKPDQVLTIIHDKMDHSKTASPCFANRNKNTEGFMKLPVSVTGMIAHGHGDVRYAHYSLDLYPADSNHTVGSIARLLRDLERPKATATGELFQNAGTTPLFSALLQDKAQCIEALGVSGESTDAAPLPPVLHVQLDNCWKDNKSRFVFCFWSLLVARGVFEEVFVSFLLVGHTHEDIDASFGRWSMKLREHDYPTLPSLMESYMNLDENTGKVIPHLIEEVPDFKAFVLPYIAKDGDKLIGHTKGQQFKFTMREGEPIMQFKILCTEETWKPAGGIKLWSTDAEGKQRLPTGDPFAATPIPMRNKDEIVKGLAGFIRHWESLAAQDLSGSYLATHGPLIEYWKGVKEALELPSTVLPSARLVLADGFWPNARGRVSTNDIFTGNGTVREEFAEDEHYIGPARQRPMPSFRVARDCGEGYMLLLRPGDDGLHPKPVWLALALSDPRLSSTSEHYQHIQVQYFTPIKKDRSVQESYQGWDIGGRSALKWKAESNQPPCWVHTDSILTAWKPRAGAKHITIPDLQVRLAKDNLERCDEDDEDPGTSDSQ